MGTAQLSEELSLRAKSFMRVESFAAYEVIVAYEVATIINPLSFLTELFLSES